MRDAYESDGAESVVESAGAPCRCGVMTRSPKLKTSTWQPIWPSRWLLPIGCAMMAIYFAWKMTENGRRVRSKG